MLVLLLYTERRRYLLKCVQIQADTEARAEEEKKQGKVKGKVQCKTWKILQPPVATGTGATFTLLPASICRQRTYGKQGLDFTKTALAAKRYRSTVKLLNTGANSDFPLEF